MLVSLGGIKRGIGMPVFEFSKLLKKDNLDNAFIFNSNSHNLVKQLRDNGELVRIIGSKL